MLEIGKAKNHERNNPSEEDVFFDATEEIEIVSQSFADLGKSLKRKGSYTITKRKSGD